MASLFIEAIFTMLLASALASEGLETNPHLAERTALAPSPRITASIGFEDAIQLEIFAGIVSSSSGLSANGAIIAVATSEYMGTTSGSTRPINKIHSLSPLFATVFCNSALDMPSPRISSFISTGLFMIACENASITVSSPCAGVIEPAKRKTHWPPNWDLSSAETLFCS